MFSVLFKEQNERAWCSNPL